MRTSSSFYIILLLFGLSLISCHSSPKRILVIHSYAENYAAYPEYNHLIKKYFRQSGIKAEFTFFYLDCEQFDEKGEIGQMHRLLDSVASHRPDIILLNDDQATYSTLKTYHPLLKTVPMVFTGVNYPNWPLLKEYPNITGHQDKMDIKNNLKFITALTGKKNIHTILDYTYLDRQVRAEAEHQLQEEEFICNLDFHLSQIEIREAVKKGYTVFTAYSIRRLENNWRSGADSPNIGVSVLWNLSKYRSSPYLQTKYDFTTETIAGLSATDRFTAINEMFGCGYHFLGGYMTPLATQVKDLVETAVRIFDGESPANIPLSISQKEYLMDWNIMLREGRGTEGLPPEVRIINIPYKAQYPVLWNILLWGGSISLTTLFFILIFLYTRETRKKRLIGRTLSEERKFLALALKGSNTYAWKIEKDIFIFENDFQKAQNLSSDRLTLNEFSKYIHPRYRHLYHQLFQETIAIGENRTEMRCDFNGTGYRWWELRYSVMEDPAGKKNVTGLLLDIEEYKAREQELIEARELAEQAELKQSFLANMSHEIRTPLNAIVGFSNILATAEEPLEREEQKQYVSLINSNSELLLKLINDILEISRIESGYMSFDYASHSLQSLLEEVYHTHEMLIPKQLQFIIEAAPTPVQLYTDKNRLTQVLTNFISNACKFTKEGYIKIGYHYLENLKQVEIYVEDTGIGIPKIEQKMIFSRFYKQNEFIQGTGLGLSICRVIIEKLNGQIELQSEPGKGSRFSVFLACEVTPQT